MLKKLLFLILFLSLAVSCWADDPPSWDLLDEDCADISDWTDGDGLNGVSEVSPAGQFNFQITPTPAGTANRNRDIGSYPNTFTAEIKVYHDTLGTRANSDHFRFQMWTAANIISIEMATEGLFVRHATAYAEVGTDLVSTGVWQTWRFLITVTTPSTASMDIYLDGVLKASGVACDWEAALTDGTTHLYQFGDNTATQSHIDYIKIADGLYTPPVAVAAPLGQIIWIK